MTIQLRPYQNDMIDGVRNELRGGASRIVLQAPTGAGPLTMERADAPNA